MPVEISFQRRIAVGPECVPGGGVHFRVWASARRTVAVTICGRAHQLALDEEGYWSGLLADAGHGTRYRIQLDGEDSFPDPASRYQPEGPHGDSEVVDLTQFRWTDRAWRGLPLAGQAVYEMHIGTFTREGTWRAGVEKLPVLAELGVTVLEVMPVAEFAGSFGWGYDGVALYAPTHLYGRPEDFCSFVDAAHALGMAVILDVVYNHLGPDGNYLAQFSKDYFTSKYKTDWGEAINYDGPNSGPVREFFAANAAFWVSEYHLDGLRLDATQNIYDDGDDHVLALIGRRVREAAAGRETIVVSENEPQETRLVRARERGGYALDGLWNDDYHHSAVVALTGHNDAYYTDYLGRPQEFISAAKYGYLYQGQWYKWQEQRRGTPSLDIAPSAFITFIENHDQVANSGRGERIHRLTSPGRLRAMTALTLLGPGTPMLFQGQEFLSSAPFFYFADHKPELAEMVATGRREFLAQWKSLCLPEMQAVFAVPNDSRTFESSKLDWSELEKNRYWWEFHRELLRLRREDPVLHTPPLRSVDGAVLSHSAFVLRWFSEEHGDRLLLVNLGLDLCLSPAPEPLLAPLRDMSWEVLLSTEDPRYGGYGTPPLETERGWNLPGECAVALRPAAGQIRKYQATKKNG